MHHNLHQKKNSVEFIEVRVISILEGAPFGNATQLTIVIDYEMHFHE